MLGRTAERVWLWGPAALQMAIIFGASSIQNLRTLPGDISDHTGHFAGYAILGLLVLRARARARWGGITTSACAQAWLISAFYGITDETHQRFVAGRTASTGDWIADALGAAAAIAIVGLGQAGLSLRDREV